MNITIDGVTYHPSLPVGATITHEGGLNQASIILRHIQREEAFVPFTRVYFLNRWWVIANDDVVRELYINRATHTIMLVEITKELETVICGAKTFTRPLVTKYTSIPVVPTCTYTVWNPDAIVDPTEVNTTYDEMDVKPPVSFYGPIVAGTIVQIPGGNTAGDWGSPNVVATNVTLQTQLVTYSWDNVNHFSVGNDEVTNINTGGHNQLYITYERRYEIKYAENIIQYHIYKTQYRVQIVPNPIAKSPLTIYEVTERLLLTADTVRNPAERAYFHTTDIAGAIDTKAIESPEFSFTNGATLKENLDQISKVLHAKVQMTIESGQALIYFVPLTVQTRATVQGSLVGDQTSFNCGKYAGRVQTNAANLTIRSSEEGAITEPSGNAGEFATAADSPMRTLRCSDGQARINEETGEIETMLPIRKVTSLKMYAQGNVIDITSWVNEESRYLALSNYDGELSKAYSLYYTKGSKNIKGLFFKEDGAIYDALTRYAIVNIYNEAAGKSASYFANYKDLMFYVEYEPYMNLRLVNSRVDGKGGDITYIANQAANEMDKDALGDFMRGTAEQMASDSPKRTYLMRTLEQVPPVGTMFDEHNYISSVSFEIYRYFVKAMLTISEHYNRFGEHVEVANAVRQYEIDVNNVRDRSVLYTDVCNISYNPMSKADDSMLSADGKKQLIAHAATIASAAWLNKNINASASLAKLTTYSGDSNPNTLPDASNALEIQTVLLPVASFGFGNSAVFVAPYKDNFSAGSFAQEGTSNTADVQFNLQGHVPYGDDYGDAEFLSFSLLNGIYVHSSYKVKAGNLFPKSVEGIDGMLSATLGTEYANTANGATTGQPYIQLFKDNRERIIFTYQVLFQSDSGIIIGNDFAANSRLVRDWSNESADFTNDAKLYLYGDGSTNKLYLHPITGTTSQDGEGYDTILSIRENQMRIAGIIETPKKHSAWAILWKGKFMIGANRPFPENNLIYFNFAHKF
ncbi:MAG: hypothetical protein IJX39_08720 [Clostridia bacterium]|nr:hypothetical protein [Clostridia bacterium]